MSQVLFDRADNCSDPTSEQHLLFKLWTISIKEFGTNANDELIAETGYGLEQHFINDDGTFRYQDAIATIDKAILDGMRMETFVKALETT